MKKNRGVAYNGKVGAKMQPRKGPTSSKATPKRPFICGDGPLKGHTLYLQEDGATLPILIKGQSGHYLGGEWQPAAVEMAA